MELIGGWQELLGQEEERRQPRLVAPAPIDLPRAAREVRVVLDLHRAAGLVRDLRCTRLSAIALAQHRSESGPIGLGVAAWSVEGPVLLAALDLRAPGVVPHVCGLLRLHVPFVAHDVKPVLLALWELGLDPDLPNVHDTYLAAACLHLGAHHGRSREPLSLTEEQELAEQREHDLTLEAQCHAHEVALSIPPAATGSITGLDARMLAARATWTLGLYAAQQVALVREGLLHHLHTIEFPYAVVNARMEWRGVHLDPLRLEQAQAACEGGARHQARVLEGHDIEPPGSTEAFLRAMGRSGLSAYFTGRSLGDGSLRKLEGLHPAVRAFRLYRRFRQQGDQFRSAVAGPDGRVHPEHRQLGAATGRSTCRAPALAGLDRVLRPVVTAPPGRALVELDYAQIELGVAAAEHQDQDLLEAYNSGDVYSAVAQRFFEDELTDGEGVLPPQEFRKRRPDLRDAVKPFVLAVLYGGGATGIAARFGMSVHEAEKRIARFLTTFPHLAQELDDAADQGLARGHAEIVTGLRRKVERDAPRDWTRRFLRNTPIQGGAAAVFKRALIELDREFRGSDVWIVLPIYDAVLIECPADRIDNVVARTVPVMQRAVRAYCPALRPRVDVNRSHPECWNKDGHADSLQRFLADPTFTLDRLAVAQQVASEDVAATVMKYPEGERTSFIAQVEAAGVRVAPEVMDDLYEQYQERAAIREYDGSVPRAEAERLAMEDVLARVRAVS